MGRFNRYAAFSKVTPQADGTLVVEGIASSESRDSQGEIVKASAMAAAIPAYMKFGNVREMHAAIAAGKAMAISVDDQGVTHLTAHVVDEGSCKKVQAGVLQGFSIGGNVPEGGRSKADATVIEAINLTEISLVDRPANPDALITLVKMDAETAAKSGEERTPGAPADQAAAVNVDPVASNPFKTGQRAKLPDGTEAIISGIQGPNIVTTGGTFPAGDCTLVDSKAQPDDGLKASPAPKLKKGMYQVADLASLLDGLAYLARSTSYEAEAEGDNSPVPAQLFAAATALSATLQALVAEEAAELLATLAAAQNLPVVDVLASAAKTGTVAKSLGLERTPVEKKGAKFSAASAATLGDVHKSLLACCEKMAGLGYEQKDDGGDDTANAEQIGNLTKRADEAESATKAAGEALTKVLAERDAAVAELAALKARKPLRAVAIGKAEDVDAPVTKADDAPPLGTEARALYEIKKSHASGGRRLV